MIRLTLACLTYLADLSLLQLLSLVSLINSVTASAAAAAAGSAVFCVLQLQLQPVHLALAMATTTPVLLTVHLPVYLPSVDGINYATPVGGASHPPAPP